VLGEVRLRRGLDPVRVAAVENLVHVRVQDPALRLLARELDRETRFGCLAAERLRRLLDVEVARELLRDRRAALHDVARADVGEERARDAGIVEGPVVPEPPVLDRDRRFRDPRAHLAQGDRLTVPLGRDRAEQRVVRGEDERVLPDLDRAQRLEAATRHPDGRAGESRDDEEHEAADQHAEEDPRRALPTGLRAAATTPAAPCDEERIRPWTAAAAAARRAHAKTPSARSAACARRRRSRRIPSASSSLPASRRNTRLAVPARSSTYTSASVV
jgi:hypothetical protein